MLFKLFKCLNVIVVFVALIEPLYASDAELIASYLNNLNNVKVTFKQEVIIDNSEINSDGVIYISKTGKVRIDYFKPEKISIVINNNKIMYHNYELSETSYTEEKNYFLDLLAKDNVSLKGKEVNQTGGTVLVTQIMEDENAMVNKVILAFTVEPENRINLKKITLYNNIQGSETILEISSIESYKPNKKLFSLVSPNFYRHSYEKN